MTDVSAAPAERLAGTSGDDSPLDFGWQAKVVVLGGGILLSLAFGALLPVLPQIEAALARTPHDSFLIKQLFGIVGLSVALTAPLAGYLADRMGARIIVIVGAIVFCVAGTAGLYLDNLPLLVFSRLLVGGAAAAVDTTGIAILNKRLSGNRRARWNGIRISVIMVCSLLMQPAVGGLATAFGWRAPFILFALGLPIGLLALGLRDDGETRRPEASAATEAAFRDWFPFRYAFLSLLIGIITYLPVVYGPFLLRERGVTSPLSISMVLMGNSIVGALSSLLYGRFKQRLSISAAFVVCIGWIGACMLAAVLLPGVRGAAAGLLLMGLGLGWSTPNLMTAVGESVAGSRQGRAIGAVRTMHEVASFLCIVLATPITARFGPEGAMILSFLLALGLMPVFLRAMMATAKARRMGSPVGAPSALIDR